MTPTEQERLLSEWRRGWKSACCGAEAPFRGHHLDTLLCDQPKGHADWHGCRGYHWDDPAPLFTVRRPR